MGTPYTTLFKSFLGKIESEEYVRMDQISAEEDLIILMNSAIVKFYYPKVNILDKDDLNKTFNISLSLLEIEILAHLMKLEWISRKINSTSLIKQKMSTSEFKLTSQAAHLESLLMLKNNTEKDLRVMTSKYSYSRNGIPDFTGMSGG